jgi:LacI family gluconate utilization system Gnt-I transcriptional repressor
MDVARIARVSPITASRAFNTPDKVSPETLARVRQAVTQTGYVPNMLAGGLASSRSRLLLRAFIDSLNPKTWKGASP